MSGLEHKHGLKLAFPGIIKLLILILFPVYDEGRTIQTNDLRRLLKEIIDSSVLNTFYSFYSFSPLKRSLLLS